MEYGKPSVFKDLRNKRWRARVSYVDDSGVKHTKTKLLSEPCMKGSNRGKSKAWREADWWRIELASGAADVQRESGGVPLADYMRQMIEAKRNSGREGSITDVTALNYYGHANRIEKYFGNKDISSFTEEDLESFFCHLEAAGLAVRSQRNAYVVVNMAFKAAMRKGLVGANPMTGVLKPKQADAQPNPLDDYAFARLRDLVGDRRDLFALMVRFAYNTGARLGEICGLRCSSIGGMDPRFLRADDELVLSSAMINIQNVIARTAPSGKYADKACTKNGHTRIIPSNREIGRILLAAKERIAQAHDELGIAAGNDCYVFCSLPQTAAGKAGFTAPEWVSRMWSSFAASNDIRGTSGRIARFHDLRHTFATHALMSNRVPVKVVSSLLGHADPGFTMRYYADSLPKASLEAMGSLCDVLN